MYDRDVGRGKYIFMEKISKSLHHIRQSLFLLCARIFFTVFLLDTVYGAILLFVVFTPLGEQYQAFLLPGFSVLHSLRFIIEVSLILFLVIEWSTNSFYLTKHQLIHHGGFLKVEENSYELTHVRSVQLRQSILGRIFNYGNILVILAVSGYHEEVLLRSIIEPKKYERILREYIESALKEGKK